MSASKDLEIKDILILVEAVTQLHADGYHRLRALPYQGPTGMPRLEIADYTQWDGEYLRYQSGLDDDEKTRILWSVGAYPDFVGLDLEREPSVDRIADHILTKVDHRNCKGEDPEYARWFKAMLAKAKELDVWPAAIAEYHEGADWKMGQEDTFPPPPALPRD